VLQSNVDFFPRFRHSERGCEITDGSAFIAVRRPAIESPTEAFTVGAGTDQREITA
jgi:hypothetical protein